MSEAVNVTGSPTLKLLIGSTTVNATYNPNESGDDALVFSYTIRQGENDGKGISIPLNALTLPSGSSITDLPGNNAVISSAAVTNNPAFKVDTLIARPSITEVGGSDKLVTTAANDKLVKGTAEAGSTLTIKAGDTILANDIAVDSKGAWIYTLSDDNIDTLKQGANKSITATAEDLAGNISDASTPFL